MDYSRFRYEPHSKSGIVWAHNIYKGRYRNILAYSAGEDCGSIHRDGHWSVAFRVNGKQVRRYCHRILWEIVNGPIPAGMYIDHIDGDRTNNKICNLRLVTSKGNNSNRAMDTRNKSGVTGVSSSFASGYEYVTASWVDFVGKRFIKSFSVAKLGYDKAFELAVAHREAMVKNMNLVLEYPYSERHGK